jgi:hypothetical protein
MEQIVYVQTKICYSYPYNPNIVHMLLFHSLTAWYKYTKTLVLMYIFSSFMMTQA